MIHTCNILVHVQTGSAILTSLSLTTDFHTSKYTHTLCTLEAAHA